MEKVLRSTLQGEEFRARVEVQWWKLLRSLSCDAVMCEMFQGRRRLSSFYDVRNENVIFPQKVNYLCNISRAGWIAHETWRDLWVARVSWWRRLLDWFVMENLFRLASPACVKGSTSFDINNAGEWEEKLTFLTIFIVYKSSKVSQVLLLDQPEHHKPH